MKQSSSAGFITVFGMLFLGLIAAQGADESLKASYPFNANADDVSGSGYHGSVTGAQPTTDRFGEPNKAYEFDGTNDYIVISEYLQVPFWNNYTISVWFLNNGNGNTGYYQRIVDKSSSAKTFFLALNSSGQVIFQLYNSGASTYLYDMRQNYFDNQWHHATVVKTGNNIQLWVDGVLSDSDDTAPRFSNGAKFVIGSTGAWTWDYYDWSGKIDDLKIYNRAISTSEIQTLYGRGGPQDSDDDHMPDQWELTYFGNITNAHAQIDSDGDGRSNLAEYIAGMNPTNAASCFKVMAFNQKENGNVINWNVVTGRVYSVYWNTDLSTEFLPLSTNIHYPQNSYTDVVHHAESAGFYRVKVQLEE